MTVAVPPRWALPAFFVSSLLCDATERMGSSPFLRIVPMLWEGLSGQSLGGSGRGVTLEGN